MLMADLEEWKRLVEEFGRACERRKLRVIIGKSEVMRYTRDGGRGEVDVR